MIQQCSLDGYREDIRIRENRISIREGDIDSDGIKYLPSLDIDRGRISAHLAWPLFLFVDRF